MAASLGQMYVLVGSPLRALLETAQDTRETQVYLSGQMNLLFYPELEQVGARRIMEFLERKEDLVGLLGQKPAGSRSSSAGRAAGRSWGAVPWWWPGTAWAARTPAPWR